MACSFIKRRLWHRCFPVKLAKLLGTLFLHDVSLRVLLAVLKIVKTYVYITTNVYFRNILLKRLSVAKTLFARRNYGRQGSYSTNKHYIFLKNFFAEMQKLRIWLEKVIETCLKSYFVNYYSTWFGSRIFI